MKIIAIIKKFVTLNDKQYDKCTQPKKYRHYENSVNKICLFVLDKISYNRDLNLNMKKVKIVQRVIVKSGVN